MRFDAMMRRKMQEQTDAQRVAARLESKVLALFPQIIQHLTCAQFEDGSPRKPGWVVLRTYRGCWELVAKEPDAGLSLTAADATLDDALVLLDTLLGDANAPWQHDPYLNGNGQKKKPNSR